MVSLEWLEFLDPLDLMVTKVPLDHLAPLDLVVLLVLMVLLVRTA